MNTNHDTNEEPENKQISDQTNTISTISEISEVAPVKSTFTQEASSQPETSTNQENTHQVVSNDAFVANVDEESTPVSELDTETVATENLQLVDAATDVPTTSTNGVQNAEHNSTDEPSALIHDNELSIESATSTNTDQFVEEHPVQEDISVDEPLILTTTEKQRILETNLTSEITADNESVTEQLVSENAYEEKIDNRSSEETYIIQLKDESQVEQLDTENVNKVPSDDDAAVPVKITTSENIQVDEFVDELSSDDSQSNVENLSTIAVANKSSDENNTSPRNLLVNVSEDPVINSTAESITNIVSVEIESAPVVKEDVKKSVEKPEAKAITNTAIALVPLSSSTIKEVSHILPTPPVTTVIDGLNPFGDVDESTGTNPFGDVDEPIDQTNPFEEDDDDTNPFNEVGQSASNNPFDDDMNTTTIFQPQYSVSRYHPIPPGTKICQMNCSSLYIYFCTIDHELFFAKLNFSDPSQPFDWQQHDDLAKCLVVSVSNRTIWRYFNKCIYTANDPINHPPFGSSWNTIKIDDDQLLLSMSVSDQCGWYIKEDGTLWFIGTDDKTFQSTNVPCSYTLDIVFCSSEKVGVTTSIGEILIRVGCTSNCPEGDGWLLIEKR